MFDADEFAEKYVSAFMGYDERIPPFSREWLVEMVTNAITDARKVD